MSYAPRIAIVGCGAIVERHYLQALARRRPVFERLVLVDKDRTRLDEVGQSNGISDRVIDYREVLDSVDGVIVALPHHLHHPISVDFLNHGVHVFCEKPLAESSAEARDMVEAASRAGVTISANNLRRLFPSYRKIKQLLSEGAIGNLRTLRYVDGENFTWPTASGFYFQKQSPAGVILDRGAHALDIICWWLGTKPRLVSCEHDSFGGMEGVALLRFAHEECTIEVKLSWLSKHQNLCALVGDSGTIVNRLGEWGTLEFRDPAGRVESRRVPCNERVYQDYWDKIVTNFIDVVGAGATPLISAAEVIPSIELIEDCYREAKQFSLPWYEDPVEGFGV